MTSREAPTWEARLCALGNAVVPQVAAVVGARMRAELVRRGLV